MTFRTNPSVVPSGTGHAGPTPADPFILTLCRLAAPVAIRPPQSPHLKQFTFFTSRAVQPDGTERVYLHMGYFGSLGEAQKWAQLMRGAYPNAAPMRAPAALLHKRDATAPTLSPPAAPVSAATPSSSSRTTQDEPLSDTQVLRILDTRRFTAEPGDAAAEKNAANISLLRPDDTQVRRALKEAVAQSAPVSFAVQLSSSTAPIDLQSVPALSIFKAYTLYTTPGSADRLWYALRLGFFNDAISAKQVAYYVRSSFESVAVVPISEDERKRASENPIDLAALSEPSQRKDPVSQRIDAVLKADREPSKPVQPTPAPVARKTRKDSLEETLEMLAASEIWNDPDSLSETGVRHLKVDVQKRATKR
ncbi:MAG TPA: hypothetical protein VG994_20380 [Steroidobacteraceae bacterium]|nr:hypothetical protein [Steroidobacteraceae bacterium]